VACTLTPEQKDELCASIIKSGNEISEKYMKEHEGVSRTASSSPSVGIRNQVYALRTEGKFSE